MSSSPAGQANFLARWMPSSSRAGVILNPSPGLADPPWASEPREPDDSFNSSFAPLPTSTNSSCVGVEASAQSEWAKPLSGASAEERSRSDQPLNGRYPESLRHPVDELDSIEELDTKQCNLSVIMKLEQLRRWQQHMQEQLKAYQLLQLQDEQQKILGMMDGSQYCGAGLSGTEPRGATLRGAPQSPTTNGCGVQQGSPHGPQEKPESPQVEREDSGAMEDTATETEAWASRVEDLEQDWDSSRRRDLQDLQDLQDLPIRPGVGGQKQTFEELLEEQLRLEEQRLKVTQQKQDGGPEETRESPPKRAFLRRGQGLSRFHGPSRTPALHTAPTTMEPPHNARPTWSNLEPTPTTHKPVKHKPVKHKPVKHKPVKHKPVKRKTAVLNKETGDGRGRGKAAAPPHRQNKGQPPQDYDQHRPRQPAVSTSRNTTRPGQFGPSVQTDAGPGASGAVWPGAVTRQVGPVGRLGAPRRAAPGRTARGEMEEEEEEGEDGGAAPEYSFERSFQEGNHDESTDLGEFELLEQAAEELSFSSASSFVVKLLQKDQEHRQLCQLLANRGSHQRRLSSTPIKASQAPPPGAGQGDLGGVEEDPESGEGVVGGQRQVSDASFYSGSELGDQEVGKQTTLPSGLCFPVQPNPPYDKRSYQDSSRDSASDTTGEEEEGDNTLIEEEDGRQGGLVFDDDDTWDDLEETAVAPPFCPREDGPLPKATAHQHSPSERALTRKVAVKGSELGTGRVLGLPNQEPPDSPAPASQLMVKLFPSLKSKGQIAAVPAASDLRQTGEPPDQQVQSRQLRERLVELEIEIERFKKENAALRRQREEQERSQEELRRERVEFERRKEEELARVAKLEEVRKEENRKLQRDRKLLEQHALAARTIPDKKEREEIQSLKQQLGSLQEELRRKESRWSTTHGRLRQQIDALTAENSSIKEEMNTLERLRLCAWRTSSADTKGVKFASPLDTRECSPPQCSSDTTRGGSRKNSLTTSAGGMKSSLRKPAGPSSSSTPVRNPEKTSDLEPTSPSLSPQRCASLPHVLEEANENREVESNTEVTIHPDGKTEQALPCGGRLIVFPNGTRKEVSADGLSATVTFFNGDTKQVMADQRVIYFYSEAQTTHTTFPDGLEILQFPNHQTEKHFPDGRKEITFHDQTVKTLYPDGREESVLTDGTIIQVNPDSTKEIQFNTGQKEVHTADYKRREYPDGTVKTVFSDGRQETRYPTGRIRVKDQDGMVISDNKL